VRVVTCLPVDNTIRYGRFTCAQKLTRWPAKSSTRHKRKNKENLKTKTSSSEETARAIVQEDSPAGRSENYEGMICETGRF